MMEMIERKEVGRDRLLKMRERRGGLQWRLGTIGVEGGI